MMQSTGSALRRNCGQTVLMLVVVIAAVAAVAALVRRTFATHTHLQIVRELAHKSAVESCRSAIGGAFGELCRIASDPRDRRFDELRRRILTTRDTSVQVTDLIGELPFSPAVEWQRGDGPLQSVGTVSLHGLSCS